MNLSEYANKKAKQGMNKEKELIYKYLNKLGEKHRVLDTGCGKGELLKNAKHILNAEAYGTEIQGEKPIHDTEFEVSVGDLNEGIDYPDNYFDVVLSTQTIEHLICTDYYLSEVRRVLKKNGVFILTTVNLAAWHYRLMLLFGIQPIVLHPSIQQTWPLKGENSVYGHKSVFTYNALKEVLQKRKFYIEASLTHTIYFLPEFICKLFPNLGTFSYYVLKK